VQECGDDTKKLMAYTPASVSTAPSTIMKSEEVIQKNPDTFKKISQEGFTAQFYRSRRTYDNDWFSPCYGVFVKQELRQTPEPKWLNMPGEREKRNRTCRGSCASQGQLCQRRR